jgi:RNA polymerase I-specific transcription initiation factor RRN3
MDGRVERRAAADHVASQSTQGLMFSLSRSCIILPSPQVCSANVVTQFARVAQYTGFIYCYSILECNKRLECGTGQPDPSASRGQQTPISSTFAPFFNADLNTFFPFDPYKLPKSLSYIQGVYREWSSVAIDDDQEDEDEDEGEDGYDPKEGVRRHHLDIRRTGALADGLGLSASLDAMSISPLRPSDAMKATTKS